MNFLKILYESLSIAENHLISILFASSTTHSLAFHIISPRARAFSIILASVLSILPSVKAFCNTFKSFKSSHLKSLTSILLGFSLTSVILVISPNANSFLIKEENIFL
jgi:hypothetical protein